MAITFSDSDQELSGRSRGQSPAQPRVAEPVQGQPTSAPGEAELCWSRLHTAREEPGGG